MKKIAFFLALGFVTTNSFGQKAKVQAASNYLRYGELDKAKEAIDLASEHLDTKAAGKTWHYRGKVYTAIANSTDANYKALSQDPLNEAYNSFTKAFEYADSKTSMSELNADFSALINPFFNKGIELFKAKSFTEAALMFEKTAGINEKLGLLDTLSVYNTGLSYASASDYPKALENYKKCLATGYGGDKLYTTMADIMVKNSQKEAALTFLQAEGLAKYPSSQNIINFLFGLYLETGDYTGALKSIDASIANEPNNAVYHYNKGYILDQKGGDEASAQASYDKAIELNPSYFDAYYNVGAMYFNKGANKIKDRNNLPLNEGTKAKTYEEEAKAYFEKALPYLEKAHNVNPQDVGTMQSLKEIYVRQNKLDKLKEVNDKLKN